MAIVSEQSSLEKPTKKNSRLMTPKSMVSFPKQDQEVPFELPEHAKRQSERPDFPNNNDLLDDKMASDDGTAARKKKLTN